MCSFPTILTLTLCVHVRAVLKSLHKGIASVQTCGYYESPNCSLGLQKGKASEVNNFLHRNISDTCTELAI